MDQDLSVAVEERDGYTVLVVSGEVDAATSPTLRAAIHDQLSHGRLRIMVDMAGVTFLDSMGLGTLVGALKRVRERSGELVVTGQARSVRRVFDITGLGSAFDAATSDVQTDLA